jgi:hypothetical protein
MAEELTKEEVDRRADELLRRMIATPPQPNWKPPVSPTRSAAHPSNRKAKPGGKV